MNAPCGHKEASCIIGNYWQCPVCDAEKTKSAVTAARFSEIVREAYEQFEGTSMVCPPIDLEKLDPFIRDNMRRALKEHYRYMYPGMSVFAMVDDYGDGRVQIYNNLLQLVKSHNLDRDEVRDIYDEWQA